MSTVRCVCFNESHENVILDHESAVPVKERRVYLQVPSRTRSGGRFYRSSIAKKLVCVCAGRFKFVLGNNNIVASCSVNV